MAIQSFDEVRLPIDISFGSIGGPEYSTDIIFTSSGKEQRNINWWQARLKYNLAPAIKNKEQVDELIAFFRARRGKAIGFRFKDWNDFEAKDQILGIGDGKTTSFQLVKRYYSSGHPEYRKIIKPIFEGFRISINNQSMRPPGFSLDISSGVVTFSAPPAPKAKIKADFQFDVPVRFDTDYLPISAQSCDLFSIKELPLIELKL